MPPPALPSSGARRVRPSPPPGRRRASGGTRVGRLFTLHGGMVGPPKRLASGESGRCPLLAARPPLSPRGRSGVWARPPPRSASASSPPRALRSLVDSWGRGERGARRGGPRGSRGAGGRAEHAALGLGIALPIVSEKGLRGKRVPSRTLGQDWWSLASRRSSFTR